MYRLRGLNSPEARHESDDKIKPGAMNLAGKLSVGHAGHGETHANKVEWPRVRAESA
jgi:hypothetical protein